MRRRDGRRVKVTEVDPTYMVACHVMADRVDAQNMITVHIPIDPMSRYIREKQKEGITVSHLGLVIAAYVRTCAEFKKLNYFVVNKNIYFRNELTVGMVVLKPGDTDGTMNKMHLAFTDTIFDIQRKMEEYIEQNRGEGETNSTDKMVTKLLGFPGLLRIGVKIFKWMDKHGMLPKKIIDASPFHCSMSISNLASIRTNHIYHHCYNFGTTSMFITMGNLVEVPKRRFDGIEMEKCLPLGITMDERICSGSYFAAAFQKMRLYLTNPHLLEGEIDFPLHSK